jgi:hypothetical protein
MTTILDPTTTLSCEYFNYRGVGLKKNRNYSAIKKTETAKEL